MKLVDATYDADEWVLVPIFSDIGYERSWIYSVQKAIADYISFAPRHPSIRDHVPQNITSLSRKYITVCEICGNKRCPHATDAKYACTDSNALRQHCQIKRI